MYTDIRRITSLTELRFAQALGVTNVFVSGNPSKHRLPQQSNQRMAAVPVRHTQVQTTQRYAHLLDDPLRVGLEQVGELLRAKPKLVQAGALA